jgi:hypothetical protein
MGLADQGKGPRGPDPLRADRLVRRDRGDRVTISWKLEGKDTRDGKDANGNVSEVRVKAEAKVTFDRAIGGVIACESSGEIRTTAKGEDPNSGIPFGIAVIVRGGGNMAPRTE